MFQSKGSAKHGEFIYDERLGKSGERIIYIGKGMSLWGAEGSIQG